jgi:hypothetical protein
VLRSACGGVLGIAVGYSMMKWLKLLLPPYSFAREVDITMNVRVLLFSLAISVFTGLLLAWRRRSRRRRPTFREH